MSRNCWRQIFFADEEMSSRGGVEESCTHDSDEESCIRGDDLEMSRHGGYEESCKELLKSEFFSVCLMIIVENYLM